MFYLKESLEIQLSRFCLWLLVRDFFATKHARCGQYCSCKTMYIHIVIKKIIISFYWNQEEKRQLFLSRCWSEILFPIIRVCGKIKTTRISFPIPHVLSAVGCLQPFIQFLYLGQNCRITDGNLSFFNSSVFCSTSTKTT